MGVSFPADYRDFLAVHDGGEGFVGENYLVLWSADQLDPYNRDYEFPEHAPALIGFGGNGGGEAFAFDTRTTPWPVVMVPFIGLGLEDAIQVSADFEGLIKRMQVDEDLF